jgi:hypothetical protein
MLRHGGETAEECRLTWTSASVDAPAALPTAVGQGVADPRSVVKQAASAVQQLRASLLHGGTGSGHGGCGQGSRDSDAAVLACAEAFLEDQPVHLQRSASLWVSWQLQARVPSQLHAHTDPVGTWQEATQRRVTARGMVASPHLAGPPSDLTQFSSSAGDSAGSGSDSGFAPTGSAPDPDSKLNCYGPVVNAAFALLTTELLPCFDTAGANTLPCTGDLAQAFHEQPDLVVALECILLQPESVPPTIPRAHQLRVITIGVNYGGADALASLFVQAVRQGEHRSEWMLDTLGAVNAMLQPSVAVVGAVCDLLPALREDPSPGYEDLALDDALQQAALTASAMLGRLVAASGTGVDVDGSAREGMRHRDAVVSRCSGHLQALADDVKAREAVFHNYRRNVTAVAAQAWAALHPRRRANEVLMGAPLAGYPHDPRVLLDPEAVSSIGRVLVRYRTSAATDAFHDSYDVSLHHHNLQLALYALGNAALPEHLDTVARYTTHVDYGVRYAAVQALRRYPGPATAPVFARILSAPPSFSDLLVDDFDVDLRVHALAVLGDQPHPPEAVVRHLHDQLQQFHDVHEGHPQGCVGRCEARCQDGVLEHEQHVVTQACKEQCQARCTEVSSYHHGVLRVLQVHGPRVLGASASTSVMEHHARRLFSFKLPSFSFHIGGTKEASHIHGSSDVRVGCWEASWIITVLACHVHL